MRWPMYASSAAAWMRYREAAADPWKSVSGCATKAGPWLGSLMPQLDALVLEPELGVGLRDQAADAGVDGAVVVRRSGR